MFSYWVQFVLPICLWEWDHPQGLGTYQWPYLEESCISLPQQLAVSSPSAKGPFLSLNSGKYLFRERRAKKKTSTNLSGVSSSSLWHGIGCLSSKKGCGKMMGKLKLCLLRVQGCMCEQQQNLNLHIYGRKRMLMCNRKSFCGVCVFVCCAWVDISCGCVLCELLEVLISTSFPVISATLYILLAGWLRSF